MRAIVKKSLWVLVAVVALVAGYFSSVWLGARTGEQPDGAIVDFSLPDLAGKQHWLSEWQGKIVVLNFWATWCGPCREEMPLLMNVHKRYQEHEVRVIGIAIDSREAVAAYAKELNIGYPLLIDDEGGLELTARYGNSRGAIPYTVIIGSDGKIVSKKMGAYGGNELETLIKQLVDAKSMLTMPK